MLTLTDHRRNLASCNVYRDDTDPLHWYYVPDKPTVALDGNGRPIFSLVKYRRPVQDLTEEERKTRLGGGLLTLSVQLTITAAQEDQIRTAISIDPAVHARLAAHRTYRSWWTGEGERDPAKLKDKIKLSSLPVTDGSVTIAILAESAADEGTQGEFTTSIVGAGKASMTGSQRVAFQAKLTQDGGVMLWEMLEADLPSILVRYDLRFAHRLDSVEMVVWCRATKAHFALQEQWAYLTDDASWSERHTSNSSTYTFSHSESTNARDRVYEVCYQSQVSGVTIIPQAPIDTETQTELMKVGSEMLADFLAATFLDYEVGEDVQFDESPDLQTELATQNGKEYGHHSIDYYKLKTWSDTMTASLNHTFTSQQVIEGRVGPNDNLAGFLTGHDPTTFRTEIELDDAWYKYLDVQIVCTTDFDFDPVDMVKVHLKYQGTGDLGTTHEVKDFIFKKDSAPGEFRAFLSSLDHLEYSYDLEVFYKGSSTTRMISGTTEDTILVLDTDALGILRVDVAMGLIDWERISQVRIDMSYGDGPQRKETQFVLSQDAQTHSWVEVIGQNVDKPYVYTVTLVDVDNQRIVLDPQRARSRALVIDSPLGESMDVRVVPVGVFGTDGFISRILVAMRYTDEPNDYLKEDIFELADGAASAIWSVPLIDKNLRSYEYQVKVIYSDGVIRETAWAPSDNAVLPLGDPFTTRVEVVPTLLNIPPGRFSFGKIKLRYDDPGHPDMLAESTMLINDFTANLGWRFRMGDATHRTYHYSLTLYDAAGVEFALPEQASDEEVLVLKPPAA